MPAFTPTQQKIIAKLSDGRPHHVRDLLECLWDELAGESAVRFHISIMRKKLRPVGEDILCRPFDGVYMYQHVRLLAPSDL